MSFCLDSWILVLHSKDNAALYIFQFYTPQVIFLHAETPVPEEKCLPARRGQKHLTKGKSLGFLGM